MIKPIFLMLFIAAASFTKAQAFPPPPAAANTSQKQLIDEFLEVSRYKEALINYAKEYLELKMFDYNVDPPKELLTKEQARTIINRFDFDDFKPSLHSSLSFISEKNLKELIQFHKGIGSTLSCDNSVFLITPSIDLNIKNQIDYAIENIKK